MSIYRKSIILNIFKNFYSHSRATLAQKTIDRKGFPIRYKHALVHHI